MGLHLGLAAFWFLFGLALLLGPLLDPKMPALVLDGTGISIGWLAIFFAFYNMVRWWSVRSYRARQRTWQQAAERHRQGDIERHHPKHEPDPNFMFTEQPPETGNPHSDAD